MHTIAEQSSKKRVEEEARVSLLAEHFGSRITFGSPLTSEARRAQGLFGSFGPTHRRWLNREGTRLNNSCQFLFQSETKKKKQVVGFCVGK